MKRRVIGIETEYGLTCATRSGARATHDADAAAHLLFEPFAQGGRAPNLYLRNGGRLTPNMQLQSATLSLTFLRSIVAAMSC